jgi:hypothetical protein
MVDRRAIYRVEQNVEVGNDHLRSSSFSAIASASMLPTSSQALV